MQTRIPRKVVHYSRLDPETNRGGVESFARNLRLCFEEVEFMTPSTRDEARVKRERLAVICDNQTVLDWPTDVPLIGFRHGVAWRKARITRSVHDLGLAVRQLRAARRPNVAWVSCARWIEQAFTRFASCPAAGVIYHPVDLERFDGVLDNSGSRLVLHDARSEHKGQSLVQRLARDLPDYRFEALACPSQQVPERMRSAAAFLHLSRYEGNSIVCNEAMAMNLPCLFTRVGLLLDAEQRLDVQLIEPRLAFADYPALLATTREFLASLTTRAYRPRTWVTEHASLPATRAGWQACLTQFDRLGWQ
jgi:hypothetical protein